MEKSEELVPISLLIETLFSKTWVIDALEILKSHGNNYLFNQGLNKAYLCAIFLSSDCLDVSFNKDEIENILVAITLKDMGKVITTYDANKQSNLTLNYIESRTADKKVIEILKNYYNYELEITSPKMKFINNVINFIDVVKEDYSYLDFANRFSDFLIKKKDFMDSLTENSNIELTKNMDYFPIQLVVETILDNIWIMDLLKPLFNFQNKFLINHSLNTALIAATILLSNKPFMVNENKDTVNNLIIGSILHDYGYQNNEKINADIHLNFNLQTFEKEIYKTHIYNGLANIAKIAEMDKTINCNEISNLVKYHHEYLDGSGFYGLKKEEFDDSIKIISLANACDLWLYNYSNEKKISKLDYNLINEKFDKTFLENAITYASDALSSMLTLIS